MEILSCEQLSQISGGDYLLSFDVDVTSNNVGLSIGFFINNFLVGATVNDAVIIQRFNSMLNVAPYLPGAHITNIEYKPLP